jgi:exosortase/archaeosortase family protein
MRKLKQFKAKRHMEQNLLKKFFFWSGFSGNLILIFWTGILYSSYNLLITFLLPFLLVPITFILNYILIHFFSKTGNLTFKNKFLVWGYFGLNELFSFSIGISIPLMDSFSRNNYALFMLPLLMLLDFILILRLNFLIKEKSVQTELIEKKEFIEESTIKDPIIEFEGKRYVFSKYSLILLAIGAPLLALVIYFFFDWDVNYWLHEIVVKQTTFLLNWLFNMGVTNDYLPFGSFHWNFNIPGRGSIYFETFCTGVQAICIFAGIILFTPHSKDPYTNRDIIWRKTKSLIISSAIFYIVNIIRMVIQIYLYYIGYAWSDIHYSISAASSFIAAIIVLLMHKWIPEFIISLIWVYALVKKKLKKGNKKHENKPIQKE